LNIEPKNKEFPKFAELSIAGRTRLMTTGDATQATQVMSQLWGEPIEVEHLGV